MHPISLNHIAYPTWDSAATYRFYTEVLRCPFVAAIQLDQVPSTGDPTPFLHTFYGLSDGGCVAFFEVDGLPAPQPDGVPTWIRHLALDVSSVEELHEWREHLLRHEVEPVGVVDHDGTWLSLYVFDPNGVRIELTVQTRELGEPDRVEGLESLQRWCAQRGQRLPAHVA
ncbi:VOC family protein [Pseudonocardia sp. ICBG601]|uniref:VOC family protein n=1 Tax=Pseudonocardia sp. ICBG601 TaxID=2846759 RepID=UPI001CF70341|nr:VOC family protein [Pseudonocardia sp. ICBG601]